MQRSKLSIASTLIAVLQLLASIVFTVILWNSGMMPEKYLSLLILLLLVFIVITSRLQVIKSRTAYIIGIIIGTLFVLILGIGSVYLMKATTMMKDIGGATYKTDNMIVVVKKDDPAEALPDAQNYTFGIQTTLDQDNNTLMLEDIESTLGCTITLKEYQTVAEEAEALLNDEIEAAIYNEAFDSIIEESVENYGEQIRVLYQYGIHTEIATEQKEVEEEDEEEEEDDVIEPFHIYISGIDVSGEITTNSRSDVNIILTANPETKQILLTTTPRDYYVPIAGISGDQRDKLTHAGIYGVDASMATLENLYGIDIRYYARVNFTSLIKIVDTLGGIDVNSECEFYTMIENEEYYFQQGINHMDGKTALAFSRERYSFEDGDNQRGRNQEAVITAILQKAMSPELLIKANELIANVSDSVETNMTQEEMARLINMQLSDGASWTIEAQAATGIGDNQACYSAGEQILYVMWPDEAVVEAISSKMKQVTGN